jgi:hypothetical protein
MQVATPTTATTIEALTSCVTDRTSRRRRKQVISESSEEEEDGEDSDAREEEGEETPCLSPIEHESDNNSGHQTEASPTERSPAASRRLTMQVDTMPRPSLSNE